MGSPKEELSPKDNAGDNKDQNNRNDNEDAQGNGGQPVDGLPRPVDIKMKDELVE